MPPCGPDEDLDHPKLEPDEQTDICGSGRHMVRGRTTAPVGQTLDHEITVEVVELGPDVRFIEYVLDPHGRLSFSPGRVGWWPRRLTAG